jgi:hypothetical protein
MPSIFEIANDEAGGLQALAVGADGTQDHWHKKRHLILLFDRVWLLSAAIPGTCRSLGITGVILPARCQKRS